MKLATYEKFVEEYGSRKSWNEEKRQEVVKKFPYIALMEGYYPECDYAHRWVWQRFGPPDCQECYEYGSEYPSCPLVLATEYIHNYTYKDSNGIIKEDSEKCYKQPENHSHDGCWTTVWLAKTGYDYGFTEYYFLSKNDRDDFVEAVPSFNLGENYED